MAAFRQDVQRLVRVFLAQDRRALGGPAAIVFAIDEHDGHDELGHPWPQRRRDGVVRYVGALERGLEVLADAQFVAALEDIVGDEIVVSWKKDSGMENANSLQCFFDIQQFFLKKASYYRETYDGIVPEFKAGLHYGFVMAGEIGVVKRDIAYSGDVLNTTARIQSKCNELGVNILISKYLLDTLGVLPELFKPKALGEISLRGKQETVMLYTV